MSRCLLETELFLQVPWMENKFLPLNVYFPVGYESRRFNWRGRREEDRPAGTLKLNFILLYVAVLKYSLVDYDSFSLQSYRRRTHSISRLVSLFNEDLVHQLWCLPKTMSPVPFLISLPLWMLCSTLRNPRPSCKAIAIVIQALQSAAAVAAVTMLQGHQLMKWVDIAM